MSVEMLDKKQREFEERVIQVVRVTKVVKGGKKMSFRALVVVGNRNSKVGVGLGKAAEVSEAVRKAIDKAKKSLITVPIINETIPHRVDVKYKAVRLFLGPAAPGTGVIAGGGVRAVLELSGIKNVLSKLTESTNALNSVYAAFEALLSLRTAQDVSLARGRQIVHPGTKAHEEGEVLRKQRDEEARAATKQAQDKKSSSYGKRPHQGGKPKGKPSAEIAKDTKPQDKPVEAKAEPAAAEVPANEAKSE